MAHSICKIHLGPDQQEISPHGNPTFPVGCYEDNMQTDTVPIHWHEEYEFIVAVLGLVAIQVGAEQFLLKAGQAVFINSGRLHSVKTTPAQQSVLRSLVILPRFIGGTQDGQIWQNIVLPFSSQTAPDYILLTDGTQVQNKIIALMLKSWQDAAEEVYDYENEVRYHIAKALRILLDHFSMESCPPKRDDAVAERMKTLLAFIETHYMEDISNQDLMHLVSCSESVLLHNFRQMVGTSPMQYVMSHRIRLAAQRLLATDEKVRSIAIACGFRDASYFTKLFKREKGLSPALYRRQFETPREK